MSGSQKQFLFISHEANITGAPLVLINFLKWLKVHHPEVVFDILFMNGGYHLEAFREISREVYIAPSHSFPPWWKRVWRKLWRLQVISEEEKLLQRVEEQQYDLIYCNTIVPLKWAIRLKGKCSGRLFCHVHELNAIINMTLPDFAGLAKEVDYFVVVSKSVQRSLHEMYGVDEKKIGIVHAFIEPKEGLMKVPSARFVVGGAGHVHWRKGYDLFLLVADKVIRIHKRTEVLFQWVGYLDTEHKAIIDEDIRKLGLEDYVQFVGQTNVPFDYFKHFSLLLMTSREDPFPLVCIEQMCLGTPIICFKGAGGTEEMLANGGGKAVGYLDVDTMALELVKYMDDPQLLLQDGELLKKEFPAYTTQAGAPQLYQLLIRKQ